MKNYQMSLSSQSRSIFLTFFVFMSISYTHALGLTSNYNNARTFKNEKFYFTIKLPADWKTDESPKANVELQLFSQSPDNQQSLSIYVIKNDEDIDLEKFAAADTMLFKNLGELVDSRKIREYLIVLKAIEKSYKTNGR